MKLCLIVVLLLFLALVTSYGEVLVPVNCDETLFLQTAQNLAEGKGMGTPLLDDLLPGIRRRTYWQPPLYFLVLSLWGRMFGFSYASGRWLSRSLGLCVLVLLFFLARQWGLTVGWSVLCVLWTGLDLPFQYTANVTRMDILTLLWVLAALLAFTAALSTSEKSRERFSFPFTALAGLFSTCAVLTHLIALPIVIVLFGVLLWRRQWRMVGLFGLPLLIGAMAWLIYASQDWEAFWGQMTAQWLRKAHRSGIDRLAWSLFAFTWRDFFRIAPSNMPPWLAIVLLSLYAQGRRHLNLPLWRFLALLVAYLSAGLGGEEFYSGWFAPFGFLLLSSLTAGLTRKVFPPIASACLIVSLLSYQSGQIYRALRSVPDMRGDAQRFLTELPQLLPEGATVLIIYALYDPSHFLLRKRPDLRLFQLSPTPMRAEALGRLFREADFVIGVSSLLKRQGLPDRFDFGRAYLWSVRGPLKVILIALVPAKGQPFKVPKERRLSERAGDRKDGASSVGHGSGHD